MKKVFLSAALAVTTIASFAFATTKQVASTRARDSFAREFGGVSNVLWEEGKNSMQKASFIMDNQTVTAFFDDGGELIATTVSMSKEQLPVKVKLAIDKKLAGEAVVEIFSYEGDVESAYFIRTEKGKVYKTYNSGVLIDVTSQYNK